MPGWTLLDTHPAQGRTFLRPLDVYELGFLWDGFFNGTADNLQYLELRLKNGTRDARLFSEDNIIKAWLSTKRRYPLAGATVRGAGNASLGVATHSKAGGGGGDATEFASEPHFVVSERDLAVLRPREVVFGSVACAEDARQRAAAILDGPRPLSEELLVQLYIFRESDSGRTDVLHLMILMAHCVADWVANSTLVRCLLDTLARGGEAKLAQIPLEDRLAMVVPSMNLEPTYLRSLSPAVRRWRRAVGIVIFQSKLTKRQGGHTLPCRLTPRAPFIAAKSGIVSTSLTRAQSATVIANCRLHDVKFGNACLVLAQVAMTRVLYRRYLRGEISEEEWEYRKRQPHISGGPLNLRRYLDNTWFEKGGGGEFLLSIGFFLYQLPFMTLGATAERRQHILSDGAPPFSDLLTFDRLLHRATLVKKQTTAFFNHPLFHEIVHAASLVRIERTRLGALQWMKRIGTANGHDVQGHSDDEVLAATDMTGIWAHGGSTVGDVDLISPAEYPLPPTHPLSPYSSIPYPLKAGYVTPPSISLSSLEDAMAPKITVENLQTRLHTRPAELYLGASSSRGLLHMCVFYDKNVFEEGVVREWLDEVREAVLWYLGQTHQSRQTPQSHGGDDSRAHRGHQARL